MGGDHGVEKAAHNGGSGLGDAGGLGGVDDFRSSVQGSISARKRGTEPLYCPNTGIRGRAGEIRLRNRPKLRLNTAIWRVIGRLSTFGYRFGTIIRLRPYLLFLGRR